MKRIIIFIAVFAVSFLTAQEDREIELTAQAILARVDRVMDYPKGLMRGNIRHIYPDGKSFNISLNASVDEEDSLFVYSSRDRGDQLKVLYKLDGEEIWVYNIHALKLYNKMGIDRFDLILSTNFTYVDLSNAVLQANYTATIDGEASIKGVDVYRLVLLPIFRGGSYGRLTVFAAKDNFVPLRIDFHDPDGAIYKFMTVARTMEKDGRVIPIRYDMLDIRKGTISILTFSSFNEKVSFNPDIFRPKQLGD